MGGFNYALVGYPNRTQLARTFGFNECSPCCEPARLVRHGGMNEHEIDIVELEVFQGRRDRRARLIISVFAVPDLRRYDML